MLSMTWLMLWNSDSSCSKLHLQHFVYRSKSPFANVEWNMCTISKCGYKHVQHFDSQPQFTLATAPELFSFWGHLHNLILSFWGQLLHCLWCSSLDSGDVPRNQFLISGNVPTIQNCHSHVHPSILETSPKFNFWILGTSPQFDFCILRRGTLLITI